MGRILLIEHVKNSALDNGGAVYINSLLTMIKRIRSVDDVDVFHCLILTRSLRNFKKIYSLIVGLFKGVSSKDVYFYSQSLKHKLADNVNWHDIDCVVVGHASALWVLPHIPKNIEVIAVSQNIEYELYKNEIEIKVNNYVLKLLLERDYLLCKKAEIDRLKDVNKVIAISNDDENKLKANGISNVLTIPPVFLYEPVTGYRDDCNNHVKLGFIGNMYWWPNIKSVDWFIYNIYEKLRNSRLEFHIYGKGSEKYNGIKNNIIGHGFVEDREKMWNDIDVIVNPIISGGGVNIKVAESLFNKKYMLCTDLALRGIFLEDENCLVRLNDVDDWIEFLDDFDISSFVMCKNSMNNSKYFSLEYQMTRVREFIND